MIYRFFSAADPIKARDLLRTMLTTRVLRPSKINGFNDPYECKIVLNLEAPDHVKRARFFEDHPGASGAECDDWLQNMVTPWSLEQDLRATLVRVVGVICFTKDWNHHLFWSHYASHHSGFCIGFDENLLGDWGDFMSFRDVTYSKSAPEFKVFFEPADSFYHKAVFTKADCWEYEREVRMALDGFEDRVVPEGAIREVIIGCRAPFELREFARFATFDGVKFFQAYEVFREYRLDRNLFDPKILGSMTSHF